MSSDVDVRLGEFWATGASNVSITTLVDGTETGPARTFSAPDTGPGGGIITVPVDPQGSRVEVIASATGPDGKPVLAEPSSR